MVLNMTLLAIVIFKKKNIEQIIHRIKCSSGQVHLLVEMMRIVLQEKNNLSAKRSTSFEAVQMSSCGVSCPTLTGQQYHGRLFCRLGPEVFLCVGGKFVMCMCSWQWWVVLFPGSAALNPGTVLPRGTLLTQSAGHFRPQAAGWHAAGHLACSKHTHTCKQ